MWPANSLRCLYHPVTRSYPEPHEFNPLTQTLCLEDPAQKHKNSCVGMLIRLWAGRQRNRRSITSRSKRLDSIPKRPNRLGSHKVYCSVSTVGFFVGGKVAGSLKFTLPSCPVPGFGLAGTHFC
jgi:hypothetical protein